MRKQKAAFDAERSSFGDERSLLSSELETLRSSHGTCGGEIDSLNSQLTREREEMARWQADLPGIKEIAVEDFKESADFDTVCNQSYIDGFEYFRQVAKEEWPDMDFSHLHLKDPDL